MKKTLIVMLSALVVMASCRSSKNASKETSDVVASQTNVVNSSAATGGNANVGSGNTQQKETKAQAAECLVAKVKVHMRQGDLDITTNGTLRMRRNDVMQLVLVDPIVGVSEIGRAEISPEGLLVIDRINKRYMTLGFDENPLFSSYGLNFERVEEYVWSEVKKGGELHYTIPSRNTLSLDVKVLDKSSNSNWEGHTDVSGKYSKVNAERFLKSLIQ